jgi:alanine dehydrogenase
MKIGTIKEIKDNENRVALTPSGVADLVGAGVTVFVQKTAGIGAGFGDEEYEKSGATLLDTAMEVVKEVDLLVKVKEPVPSEYPLLDAFKGKTLFTYLHLSGVYKELTMKFLENNITAIAYETVKNEAGDLPLLAPMSQVAGVLAVQYGAQFLQKKYNGAGVSLGAIHGADPAEIVILGAGSVGASAARFAGGMGAHVTLLNRSEDRLKKVQNEFKDYLGKNLFNRMSFLQMNDANLQDAVKNADLLVGAVLIPGAKAPVVVKKELVNIMKKGAVIIDVSMDQGGCIWGSKPTTHSNPVYYVDNKIYCCITNMPGQVARQSTQALVHVTLPYVKLMAEKGVDGLIKESLKGGLKIIFGEGESFNDKGGFAEGVNIYQGKITYKAVAEALQLGAIYSELKALVK